MNLHADMQVQCHSERIYSVVQIPETTYIFELKVDVQFNCDMMTVGDWVMEKSKSTKNKQHNTKCNTDKVLFLKIPTNSLFL